MTAKKIRKIFLIFFLLMLSIMAMALKDYAYDEPSEEINLYMNEVKVIEANNPSRIAIGNPAVVDVARVSKNEITLSPKGAGTTTFVFWDNFGEQSYRIRVFAQNMQEAKRRVDSILGELKATGVSTYAQDEEGKVILLGSVKSTQDKENIKLALGTLKDSIVDLVEVREEETVIAIDVQILELNKDATKTLGFSWPGSRNNRLNQQGNAS